MSVEALEINVSPPSQQGVDRLLSSVKELETALRNLEKSTAWATIEASMMTAETASERLTSEVKSSSASISASYKGVAASGKVAIEDIGKAMQNMQSVVEEGSAMNQILLAKDAAAYEKAMQAELAARADAYTAQKTLAEKQEVELFKIRTAEANAYAALMQSELAARADTYEGQKALLEKQEVEMFRLRTAEANAYEALMQSELAARADAYAAQKALAERQEVELFRLRTASESAYEKLMQSELASRADAYAAEKALAEKQEVELFRLRTAEENAYEKLMQAELAARADAYAAEKALAEKQEVELYKMEQARVAAHAAALKAAEDLDIAYYASTLQRQLEMAKAAQRLDVAGGDPVAKFGVAASSADIAELTAQYKALKIEQKAAAAADAEHRLSMRSTLAQTEAVRMSVDALTGQYGRLTRSSFVLSNATGLTALAFSPVGVAIGLVVGGLAALGYAAIKAQTDQTAIQDALVMTGGYAGQTADAFNAMALRITAASGNVNSAKQAITELTASGKLTAGSIQLITEAAVALEHSAGVSIEKTIKEFESLAVETTGNSTSATNAVTKAAIKLNDTYGFLTESIVEQIHAMERDGDAKGASALAIETLARVTKERSKEMEENVGNLVGFWRGLKEEVGKTLDLLGEWGKKATPASELAKAQAELVKAQEAQQNRNPFSLFGRVDDVKAIADAQDKVAYAMENVRLAQKAVSAEGENTRMEQLAIHEADKIFLYDQKHKKDNLSELQIALQDYYSGLEAIAKSNPTSPLLEADAVAQGVQNRINDYVKNNKSGVSDAYRAEQNALQGILKLQEQQIAQLDKIAQLRYKVGQIGTVELIQADTDKLVNTALAKIAEAVASSAAASKYENRTAVVAKNNETIKQEQDAIQEAYALRQQKLADFEKELQIQVTKDHIEELKARGHNQEAAQLESEASYRIYIDRLKKDSATLSGTQLFGVLKDGTTHFSDAAFTAQAGLQGLVGLVNKALDQVTAKSQALVDAGEVKDLQAQFQTAVTGMEASVAGLGEKAAEGGGLLERMQLAQAADVARQQTIPALETIIQRLQEMNQQDPGVAEALAKDTLALNKLKTSVDHTWTDLLKDINTNGSNLFKSLFSSISGSFKSEVKKMRDTFQNDLLDFIYKQMARPFVMNIVASVAGSLGITGLAQAAQAASGGSSLLSAASGASSMYSSGSSLASMLGFGGQLGAGASATGGVSTLASGATYFSDAAFTASQEIALSGTTMMGGITSAVMAIPGWGWALAAAALLVTQMGGGEMRSGGGYNIQDGRAVLAGGPSGGEIDSSNVGKAIEGAYVTLTSMLTALDSHATIGQFTAGLESSHNDKGGTFAGGYINGKLFGQTDAQKVYSQSLSPQDAVKQLGANLQQAVIQALQAANDIPKRIADKLKDVDAKKLTSDAATALLATISTEINGVNQLRAALNTLPFNNLKNLSFNAADGLIQLAGGVQNLQNSLAYFSQNFYSEDERMATMSADLTKQLEALGYTGITTADQFKDAVNAIDPTTDAAQELYVKMLALAPAMKQVSDYSKKAASDAIAAASASSAAALKAAADAKAALKTQVDDAFAAVKRAVDAQKAVLQTAYDAQLKLLQAQAQTGSTSLQNIQAVFNALNTALKTTQPMARDVAQGILQRAVGTSNAGGSLTNVKGLTDALQAMSQPSEDLFATFQDYQRDQQITANTISALNDNAGAQVSVAQMTLDAINASIDELGKNHDADMAGLDKTLADAQAQIDALNDVDTSVKSVADAVSELALVLKVANAAKTAAAGGAFAKPVAGGSTAPLAANTYHSDILDYGAKNGGDALYLANNHVGQMADAIKAITTLPGSTASFDDLFAKAYGHTLSYWEEAQRQYDAGLHPTTTSIQGFASGGDFGGGLRMVGEHGPEIEVTGPSRIFNAAQTSQMLSGGGNSEIYAALVAEIRQLRAEMQAQNLAIAQNTRETAKFIKKWDGDGLPATRTTS